MPTKHINDLKRAFFGGGNDAEYAYYASGGGSQAGERGMVFPPNGLPKFAASTNAMRHIVMLGDSVIQSDIGTPAPRGVTPSLRDIYRNRHGAANVHFGYQGIWRQGATAVQDGGVWALGGTWTITAAPMATVTPVGSGAFAACFTGTGSTAIATWTRDTACSVERAAFLYVDHSSIAGAVNPSYSVDGGTTWVDLPLTRPATATLKRVLVTGLSNPATIRVRGANSAGVSSTAHLPGIEVYGSATGVTVHNIGLGGSQLSSFIGNLFGYRTPGQWFALVQPELVVFQESNSSSAAPSTSFIVHATDADLLFAALNTNLLVIGQVPQAVATGRTDAFQAAWRSLYLGAATRAGGGFINMGSRWGTYPTALAAGLMSTDGLHTTTAGGLDMAATIDRYLRRV